MRLTHYLEQAKIFNGCIESNARLKGAICMELAKITLRGQITIPVGIRKKLGVKDGDKVVFIEENGRIVIENSVRVALKEVQEAFQGEAERVGLKNEQDVVAMIKKMRKEKRGISAGHA
jgi:AbrB family looped-hinge helix DNA binding protein